MKLKLTGILSVIFLIISCASVPKESVELSATVGRDLVVAHKAHREMAKVLFGRMKKDIHRFVDLVYAPHQINAAIARQKALADSADQELRNKSLLLAINKAFSEQGTPKLQQKVLDAMQSMVGMILKDIEKTRLELIEPIYVQEKEMIQSIDRAYGQMQYANSVVTGHLASIRKVHDAQADILATIGVERDLRTEVSHHLSNASNKVGEIVASSQGHYQTIGQLTEKVRNIKATIEDLTSKLEKVENHKN